ncbi:MAG: chorismate mutase [Synechococcus sp. SB0666_bin_14]|nr:chorismate mutase [Synechococcus sp. SB0666_bin_14]MYA91266.1 chorismate mutase [Synechococcus sp. SB0663_bin_10]MYG47506.1 chorismate mutase [Synechococcus sp. SB0675_bin_6]MYJ59391.1 chorismate mutase [Synechococcus sp. SB0672_bin_6]MYK91338.1 chorismate mutase [Synechococcus sp. SB0669_bin_8]
MAVPSMTNSSPPCNQLVAWRGATTVNENTTAAVDQAVSELLDALVNRNQLQPRHLISVVFSVTADLDAMFPASVARRRPGWEGVALLDTQQMHVPGNLGRCIRLLAHGWLPEGRLPEHPYLRGAVSLRPDRQ